MRRRLLFAVLSVVLIALPLNAAEKADVSSALAAIKSVGREGAGNEAAAVAWKQVVAAGGDALLPTLTAFDGASPTAANWLRSAVDAITESEKRSGREVPVEDLRTFVQDTKKDPTARRIAFELYSKADPTAGRMLPRMIDDPSQEIRRDAIAARLPMVKLLAQGNPEQEKVEVRKLFHAARDTDQVEQIAEMLKKLGEDVDLTKRFGFLTQWHVVGPFDSTDGAAFAATLPPEEGVKLDASYSGKDGMKLSWKPAEAVTKTEGKSTTYATLDFNTLLGNHKFAAACAYTVVEVEEEMQVDIRAACQNSVVIHVNGKPIFARDEYHHGTRMDQHVGKAKLKPGKNEILVKVCQNDQKDSWAQAWTLQLRICDRLGGPVAVKMARPKP